MAVPIQPLATQSGFRVGSEAVDTTLLDLVQAVGDREEDDREVAATVVELLRCGRFRLIGNFRGTNPDHLV